MDTASDYEITNPYNPPDHNGVDRAMPIGIPLVISKVVVAYSGNTGKSTGPHTHSQAGTDAACQNVVDPRPYEFKPGTVTAVRTTDPYIPGQKGGEWGKYFTIKTLLGKYITYAHLSQVNVTIGQRVGGENMPNEGDVHNVYLEFNNRKATPEEVKVYTSKSWSAGDGLYYGKVVPEVRNLKKALEEAQKTGCSPEERQFLDLRKKI